MPEISSLLRLFADTALKSVALLGLLYIILNAPRRMSAAFRYRIHLAALLGLLLIPLLTRFAPSFEVGLLPEKLAMIPKPEIVRVEGIPASAFEAAAPRPGGPDTPSKIRPFYVQASLVLVLWGSGVLLLASRLAVGYVALRRAVRKARPVGPTGLGSILAGIPLKRRNVRWLESPRVAIPVAVGWNRPAVLLPPSFRSWPAARLRVVLLHEAAHINRGDVVSSILAYIASIFFWFNPFVWLVQKRLRLDRERACDEDVLTSGVKASDYSAHLLAIARLAGGRIRTWVAGAALAGKSTLEVRLMSMLDTSTTARRVGRTGRILTALSVSAAFLVLGGLRIWAHRESAPISLKPSLQQTEILPQEAVRARLGDLYKTLEALDFRGALEYFSGVPDTSAAVRVPVFLVRKIEEKKGWELTLPSAESFVSLAVEPRILSVEPEGDGWLVTEELTISRKTKSGVRQILVRNPNHKLKFVRDGDQWKIDGRKRIDISPKPVEGSKLHVGLAFGMDGISCLWIESPKVLEPPGWRKAALVPRKEPSKA